MTLELRIARTWDGEVLADGECVVLSLAGDGDALALAVDAPYHGDPAPSAPAGPTPGLWDYEVVELFLLGRDERYLEIELGPHGHHWVLELGGRRRPVRSGLGLDYHVRREGPRWRGRARIPRGWLPPGTSRANAYAIHGLGAERRFLAWRPVPGEAPDFHRLEHFAPVALPGEPGGAAG